MARRMQSRLAVAAVPIVGVVALFAIRANGDNAVAPVAPITPVPPAATQQTGAPPVAGTVQGPSVDMRWGLVQVTIVVKNKQLMDVEATAPTERQRSADINGQAIPWLRSEALQAHSANINLISGATMTSDAFTQSLQAALAQASI
jgi:uncharacterized protein with FMN-binding domain